MEPLSGIIIISRDASCPGGTKVKEAQKFELGVFTKLVRTNCQKLTVNAKDKEGKSYLTCLMG